MKFGSFLTRFAVSALALSPFAFGQLPIVVAAPDLQQAVPLNAINTAGWEDSAQVLPDGSAIYFSYMRIDPIWFILKNQLRVPGPMRPGWPSSGIFSILGADIYVSSNVGGTWQTPVNLGSPINVPQDCEGDVWISADASRILYTNGDGDPTRPKGVYYSHKANGAWANPVLASTLGFPFLPGDANPHLTLDEKTLFFESQREGGYGGADIWTSHFVNGAWQPAVNLGPSINSSGTEGSPFSLDGKVLYFDDKGASAIYRSVLQSDGNWSPREVVVSGNVGDPSMTLNGDLYFVGATTLHQPSGTIMGYDANLYVAKKVVP